MDKWKNFQAVAATASQKAEGGLGCLKGLEEPLRGAGCLLAEKTDGHALGRSNL